MYYLLLLITLSINFIYRVGDENYPMLVQNLANETIIRVACGDGQTLAVSTSGEVWGWGTYKDKEGKKWFHRTENSSTLQKQHNEPYKIQVSLFLSFLVFINN